MDNILNYIVNFLKNIFNRMIIKDEGDDFNKNEISEVNTENTEDNKFSKNKFIESDVTFNDNSRNSNNSNNVMNSNNHNVVNNTYNMTVNNFNIINDRTGESLNRGNEKSFKKEDEESLNKEIEKSLNEEELIKYILYELYDDIQIKKVVSAKTTPITIIVVHSKDKY